MKKVELLPTRDFEAGYDPASLRSNKACKNFVIMLLGSNQYPILVTLNLTFVKVGVI